MIDNACEYLDADVLRIFRGQTVLSPVLLPLIGSLLIVARPRVVMLTERSVLTFEQSTWSQSTLTRLVSRHERGSVTVEVTPLGMKIAGEDTIFALPGTLKDMRDVASLAGRAPD